MVRERRAKGTVCVDNIAIDLDRQTARESGFCLVDKLVVKTDVETVILLAHLVRGCARTHFKGWLEQSTQVNIGRLGRAQRVVD